MRINEHIAIHTNRVHLVPYCRHHVTAYHDWMQDPDIQIATASEPLSLTEEYSMQASWRSDPDKLTFILCLPSITNSDTDDHKAEITSMIGDVNMFLSVREDDGGRTSLVGELELMIANRTYQRKGLGRCSLLAFLNFVLTHEDAIIEQYRNQSTTADKQKNIDYFTAKIGETNERSILLFESIGFEKISATPSFFGEFELRHYNLSSDSVKTLLSKYKTEGYQEVDYQSNVDN